MRDRDDTYYKVTRTSAIQWQAEAPADVGRDRIDNLTRFAGLFDVRIKELCPELFPEVEMVPLLGSPQLRVTMTLPASDTNGARERADYWVMRALSAKVATGRIAHIDISWGEWELEVAK